jgi:hypothetical protein
VEKNCSAHTVDIGLGIRKSLNLMPHFESVDGRQVFYVDGWPFTVLTVEIPWVDLIYGCYAETMHAYDYLYPAAKQMGLNALKVPIKWSMIEPEKGAYDFSYLDHVVDMARKNDLRLVLGWFGHYASGDGNIYRNLTGEVFAPMYVIEDDETYPRAVDAVGVAHHNAASYDYEPIIEVEVAAFSAFMQHIGEIDGDTKTILVVQVENEIAVFGSDRRNRKLWRDHSPASDEQFEKSGFTDDLKYSASRLSSGWIKPLTDAGAKVYPLPLFCNFVSGNKLVEWMIGGAPGEDVVTYLENCPNLSFIGRNLYLPDGATVNDMRAGLNEYRVGRNVPSITETNSDPGPVGPRLAYVAVGEYGAPLYAPWALNVSYPGPFQPYVLRDGTIANGGPALRDCYLSLGKALPQVSYYGGTDVLKVFMSNAPGERFSMVQDVNGAKVTVSGAGDGQAIVIHPEPNEFTIVGYRCHVSIDTEMAAWPALRRIRIESGFWDRDRWQKKGECWYTINQSASTIGLRIDTPQAVRVRW